MGQGLEDRRAGQLTRLCAEAGTWTAVLTQLTWEQRSSRSPWGQGGDARESPFSAESLGSPVRPPRDCLPGWVVRIVRTGPWGGDRL